MPKLSSEHAMSRPFAADHADVSPGSRLEIVQLMPAEWEQLSILRLAALRDSPETFLSTYDRESAFKLEEWESEFKRGDWHAGRVGERFVSMMGVTREASMPFSQCYIEYMWVSPELRGLGVGRSMLAEVLAGLKRSGVETVFLWVLNGNDIAVRLYEGMGFAKMNESQPIPNRPGRSEERMVLSLR